MSESANHELLEASAGGDLKTVVRVLNANPNILKEAPDEGDHAGESALFLATRYGHLNVVKELLKRGADVNEYGKDNQEDELEWATPLHMAARYEHTHILNLLLKQPDIDITLVDGTDDTALHYAALNASVKSFNILLRKGADYTLKNEAGYTPFEIAEDAYKHKFRNVPSVRPLFKKIVMLGKYLEQMRNLKGTHELLEWRSPNGMRELPENVVAHTDSFLTRNTRRNKGRSRHETLSQQRERLKEKIREIRM